MTKQQFHDFAHFIMEYCDFDIDEETFKLRHEINVEELNFKEAVEAYIKHHKLAFEPNIKRRH